MVIKYTFWGGLTWNGGHHPRPIPIPACLLGAVELEVSYNPAGDFSATRKDLLHGVVVKVKGGNICEVGLDNTAHGAPSLPPLPCLQTSQGTVQNVSICFNHSLHHLWLTFYGWGASG